MDRMAATFLGYTRGIWSDAVHNGKSRGVGVLLGFLVNGILLAVQVSLGLYSTESTTRRWASFIGVQLVGLVILFAGHVWHAAWLRHVSDTAKADENFGKYLGKCDEATELRIKLRDVCSDLAMLRADPGPSPGPQSPGSTTHEN